MSPLVTTLHARVTSNHECKEFVGYGNAVMMGHLVGSP